MNIQVTAKPYLLLEGVELLYAWVNGIDPQALAGEGEYSLPAEVVQEMMDTACAGISRDDPVMVYYFGSYTLPEKPHLKTCIARHLAYSHMFISKGSVAADCDYLRQLWNRQSPHRAIVSLGDFSAQYEDEAENSGLSLLDSIQRLGLDPQYTRKLTEQFSDFDGAVSRLQEIVTPVVQRLEPLLEPWVARGEKLAQLWRDCLASPEALSRFLSRICFRDREQIDQLSIQLRYLSPEQGPGQAADFDQPHIHLHIGVCISVGDYDPDQFLTWEFEAMRLLGSPVRLRMLHALWDTPMSSRELARALNLNLGTLCRDMNSLYECRLLILETVKDRRRYRTNRETMAHLAKHLARFGELQLSIKNHI